MNMRMLRLAFLTTIGGLLVALPASGAAPGTRIVKIRTLPYEITEPGSYIITRTLTDTQGITISASSVTLDLNGFYLTGHAGSGDAIMVSGQRSNIEIFGGTINGWGGGGIVADSAFNSSFHDLRLEGNGLCGLRAGHSAVVERIVAQYNGGTGVAGAEGIVLIDSALSWNAGLGADVGPGSQATGLTVVENLGGGILADSGSRIVGNAIRNNGSGGGSGGEGSSDGACSVATLSGITVLGTGSVIQDNVLNGNHIGLQLIGDGNVVKGNMVRGGEDNYELAAGNQLELLLCEVPETIDWPAAITLAGSLTGKAGEPGITIHADGVSIDLADHVLQGVPGSLAGIYLPEAHTDLSVRNGVVDGWGGRGIDAALTANSVFEDLIVQENTDQGLRAGDGATVLHVNARANGIDGIRTGTDSLVTDSAATENGNDGIQVGDHSMVIGSVASENALFGIKLNHGSMARECTASRNTFGIAAEAGATIAENTTCFNSGVSIRAMDGCMILNNFAHESGTGIAVLGGSGSRVEGNNLANNSIGLEMSGTNNLAIRNSASGNELNYSFGAGNCWGTIRDLTSGGSFTNDDPWANFEY